MKTTEKLKNNLNNALRAQAGLLHMTLEELKKQKEILKQMEDTYDEEISKAYPDEDKLKQMNHHIAMQEEVIAEYQKTAIECGAKENEL